MQVTAHSLALPHTIFALRLLPQAFIRKHGDSASKHASVHRPMPFLSVTLSSVIIIVEYRKSLCLWLGPKTKPLVNYGFLRFEVQPNLW